MPVPRFKDNGDGTVTDNMTGLMWLKNANCISNNYPGFDNDNTAGDGQVTWQHSLEFVAGINDGTYSNCDSGYSDWRLPNINELHSLIDYGNIAPALATGHPFSSVESSHYWSATNREDYYGSAWIGDMVYGNVSNTTKPNLYYVWPVRGPE